MKKLFALLSAGLVIGALLVSPATAAKSKMQMVDGSIALPAPFTDDSGCYAGVHRRIAILTGEAVNGDVGYHFDIDKTTWNKPFNLAVTGGLGTVDLDIMFYDKFGTTDDVVNDPTAAGAPMTAEWVNRKAGGESGIVPANFNKAIVCMYAGAQGYGGFNASFHYMAGAGVKPTK